MPTHRVSAGPDTAHWGTFNAAHAPILTIESGDTVILESVSGPPEIQPLPAGMAFPAALTAIHARTPRLGPHILTGPIAIRGAVPGDTLEVRIEAVELAADWGYCGHRPLAGTLPEDFHERFLSHVPVDRAARTCTLPWGTVLPLQPFFGVMGVAPRPAYGALSTKEPREHGGNLDNKELGAGSTLFLPVFVDGANFSAGDGHGVQGDGEVCINALEMALTGTFTFVLHKGGGLRFPRGETPTHYISMGMNEDLDQAMKQALREMIAFIAERAGLSRDQAYQLCSLAADFRVTQTVNGEKGVHGMLRKSLLP